MDALSVLLDRLKKEPRAHEHFLGLLHVLIGRKIISADGQTVSQGLNWRDLAAKLKKIRWDPDVIGRLGLAAGDLPPRDRERFWYQVVVRAQVDSAQAQESAVKLGEVLRELGYEIV